MTLRAPALVSVLSSVLIAAALVVALPQPALAQPSDPETDRLRNPAATEAAPGPRLAAEPTDVVADGGFEAGSPNPSWDEGSTTFGSPLCTVDLCGVGGGTGAHSGDWWAWFGGIGAVETGFVRQELPLAQDSTAELRFWLEIPAASGSGEDFLTVSLGGTEVFGATDADAAGFATYTEVVVDVSAFADGGTHTLSFDSTVFGPETTNFFVDDVSLTVTEDEEPPPGGGCDQTVLGVHPGPLTVTEGTTCLAAGAMVLGEVNVLAGAGLVAAAAVVQGPVSASGANLVDPTFAQVTGPVTVAGATGSVSLFGNQITGSVLVLNSQLASAPVLAGNTVTGSLTCLGNEPPPTNHGLPNTVVGGVKTGQCEGI